LGVTLAVFPAVDIGLKSKISLEPELYWTIDTMDSGWRASILSWTLKPDSRLKACVSLGLSRRARVNIFKQRFIIESGALWQAAQTSQYKSKRWRGSLGFQAQAGYKWRGGELSLIYRGSYLHRLDSPADRIGIGFSYRPFKKTNPKR